MESHRRADRKREITAHSANREDNRTTEREGRKQKSRMTGKHRRAESKASKTAWKRRQTEDWKVK